MFDQSKPTSHQPVFRLITMSAVGVTLLFLAGSCFTGACLVLIMATPVLVLFSPVLVSAGIVTFFITTGFFLSGRCGMASMTTLLWMNDYVTGKHPPGADKLDYAMERIANKVREVKYRSQMYGLFGQYFHPF